MSEEAIATNLAIIWLLNRSYPGWDPDKQAMLRMLLIGMQHYVKLLKQGLLICFQVFNILTLCAEPFTVEPEALEFLGNHAFDFNRLIDTGVRYYPSTVSKVSARHCQNLLLRVW
ncbi:hypothetical protein COOONC_19139 [Cooperia oncophora]